MSDVAVHADYVQNTTIAGGKASTQSDLARCLHGKLSGKSLITEPLSDSTVRVFPIPFVPNMAAREKLADYVIAGAGGDTIETQVIAMLQSSAEMQRLLQYGLNSVDFYNSLDVMLNAVASALQIEVENTDFGRRTVGLSIEGTDL